ncbi:MAG: FG-GAP-like repeat-containing protein, partial [Terriglobia bacterium]
MKDRSAIVATTMVVIVFSGVMFLFQPVGAKTAAMMGELPGRHRPPDLARAEEAKSPLLAGDFAGALQTLPRQIVSHPGDARFPYYLATVYLRLKRYAEGIPYARMACKDDPADVRYRWMLRVLTILAGKPQVTIPLEDRLAVQPSARSPVHFVDVTKSAGVENFALGRGAAWGDFDNDGRDDLLVCAERSPFRLFRNLGNGKFAEVAEEMGLFDPVGLGCYAANFVDYDNDGFEDIFFTSNGWGGDNRLFLFHNDHGRRFVDVTQKAGLGGTINAFGAAWADYDGDGYVDLVVATGIVRPQGGRLRLYHNNGDETFSESGLQAGLTQRAHWMSA